ncbi:WXG100-like domain-containing protein [Amycolatopsis sp. NPDC003676]
MSGYDAVETPWGCYADISEPTDNDLWRHVVSYGGYRHDELWPADSAAVASATGDEWLAGATAVDEAVASSSAVSSAIEQTWPDPAGVLLRHNISTVNTAGPGETGMTQLSGEMKELAQAYQSYGRLIHGVKSTILKQLDSYDTKYSLAGLAGERMKQSFARHVAPSFAAIITAAVGLLEGKELPESKAPKEKAHGPLGLLESMWDATVGQLYGMVKGLAGFGEGGWSWSNLGDAWGALGTHVLANITYSPTGLMLGLPVLDQTVGLPGFQPGDMGYQLFQQAADFIDVDDWETNPWAAVGTDIGNVLTVVGTDGVGGALRSLGEVAESSKFGAIAKTGSAAARAGDAILTASPYLHPFSTTLVKGLGQVPKIVDHLRTPGRAGRELDAAGPSHVRDTDRPPPADPPHEPPVPGSVGEAVEKSPGGTAGPHPSAPARPAADAPRTPPDGTGHNPAAASPPGVSPPVRPAPGTPDVPGGPRPVHPRPDASPDPARPAGPPHQAVPPDDRVVPSSPPPRPPTAAAPHPAAEAAHVGPHPGEVPHGEGRPGTEQPGSGAVAPHPSAETGAAAGKSSHGSDSLPPQREHPDAKPSEVRREPAQPVTPLVEGREAPKEAASGSSGKPPGGPPRKPPGPGREAEPPAEGEPNGKPEREPDGAEPQRSPGETSAPRTLPPGDPGLPPRDQGAYVAHVDRNTGEVTVEHRPAEAEPPSTPDREGPAPDRGRPEPPGTAEPGHPGARTGLPAPGSDEARLEGHDTHDVQDNPRIKASTKFQLAMFAGLRMSSLLHSGFDMWDIWHGVPHPPTGGPTDLPSSRPNPRGPRRGPGGNPDGTVARFDPETGRFRLVRPENAAAAPGVRPHPEPPRELPEREGPHGAEPDSGRGAENPDGAARRGPDEDPEPRPGDDGPIGPKPPKGPDSPQPGGGRAAEPERTPPESRDPERGRGEETAPDPESPGKPGSGGPPHGHPEPDGPGRGSDGRDKPDQTRDPGETPDPRPGDGSPAAPRAKGTDFPEPGGRRDPQADRSSEGAREPGDRRAETGASQPGRSAESAHRVPDPAERGREAVRPTEPRREEQSEAVRRPSERKPAENAKNDPAVSRAPEPDRAEPRAHGPSKGRSGAQTEAGDGRTRPAHSAAQSPVRPGTRPSGSVGDAINPPHRGGGRRPNSPQPSHRAPDEQPARSAPRARQVEVPGPGHHHSAGRTDGDRVSRTGKRRDGDVRMPPKIGNRKGSGPLPGATEVRTAEDIAADKRPPEPGPVPRGFPSAEQIRLTDNRKRHILDGDPSTAQHPGGGHRSGAGVPGKTEFPRRWTEQQTHNLVLDVARKPDSVRWDAGRGNWNVFGMRDGVMIEVVIDPAGRIRTSMPLYGRGVYQNPRN